jgi:hypothetical protein
MISFVRARYGTLKTPHLPYRGLVGRGFVAWFPVVMAAESHPFPSRTRKLSLSAPMVLEGLPSGRVGHRRNISQPDSRSPLGGSCYRRVCASGRSGHRPASVRPWASQRDAPSRGDDLSDAVVRSCRTGNRSQILSDRKEEGQGRGGPAG